MENMSKKKMIFKLIMFLGIGLILFYIISMTLLPEWIYPWEITLTIRGFYNEPKDTLDTVFIGDSGIYRAISPMEIWKDYGITSYGYSSQGQRVWYSYYLMKECFKYQKPKVIVFDVNEAFDESDQTEENGRKVFDNMRLNKNKIETLNNPDFKISGFDKLSYYIPIIRYHSRWDSLGEWDFRRMGNDYYNINKGYIYTGHVKPYDKKPEHMKKDKYTDVLGEKAKKYMKKMIELCKENGTQLVLMELPSVRSWSYGKSQEMQKFATEHNLEFLDLNIEGKIEINWNTDSEDVGYHLNINGAEKVSKYLGKYLKEKHDVPDRRNEEKYSFWHKEYKEYAEKKEIDRKNNL